MSAHEQYIPEVGGLVFDTRKTVDYARNSEWMTCPPLIISNNDRYLPGAESTPDEVKAKAHEIINDIARSFEAAGSRVYRDGNDVPLEDKIRSQSIGIFYLGRLSDEVANVLESPLLDNEQVIAHNQDALPQNNTFHEVAVVRQWRKLGLGEVTHPGSFRTLTMIEDPTGIIKDLSARGYEGDFDNDHRLEGLIRQILPKHGALSTILQTYHLDEASGQMVYDDPILCTLEGAHPVVPSTEELAIRLMEIGSSRTLEIERDVHPSRQISYENHANNPFPNYLRQFMSYLGIEQEAFSTAIKIMNMVATHNPAYAERLIEFIKWAGQAEGAGGVKDPVNQINFWSKTGRFEAIKSNLRVDEIIATVPWPEGWDDNAKTEFALRIISVIAPEELITAGMFQDQFPSVESGPMTYASVKLDAEVQKAIKQGKIPPLNFVEEAGVAFIPNEAGPIYLSPVTGWFHLHRTFEPIDNNSVFHVKSDLERFPAVPCGTDAERDMFYDAHRRAWLGWEAGGRVAALSVFYMPGHGMLGMTHPTAREDGSVPHNPFELTKKAFEIGDLVLRPGVDQDNSRFAVRNMYIAA